MCDLLRGMCVSAAALYVRLSRDVSICTSSALEVHVAEVFLCVLENDVLICTSSALEVHVAEVFWCVLENILSSCGLPWKTRRAKMRLLCPRGSRAACEGFSLGACPVKTGTMIQRDCCSRSGVLVEWGTANQGVTLVVPIRWRDSCARRPRALVCQPSQWCSMQ